MCHRVNQYITIENGCVFNLVCVGLNVARWGHTQKDTPQGLHPQLQSVYTYFDIFLLKHLNFLLFSCKALQGALLIPASVLFMSVIYFSVCHVKSYVNFNKVGKSK
ncbi:hypothetical protein ILYODFUR_031454 [Ilyodon furcidens]|uniref:Uncharacterized protein n=1 Tax=Ilyodon furcidens TaxID=33524 RepID=A0ABV0SR24_9TELE